MVHVVATNMQQSLFESRSRPWTRGLGYRWAYSVPRIDRPVPRH